ncbi:FMN-binding negative transcriptional regulator [Actinospica durhamensis]|uniref:FMN-binding negative transcriptional regulator n=1 Tax=Actinospica durhamensis TaxID=1508375 RepID=A0A941EKP8_9ACTN|nr:FMN-binding negative transcriptional regulator [Actinospica durhamensis]MBR7833372.1 FMN-binding negative transcriptional regulator [Actinospica durhamensis]
MYVPAHFALEQDAVAELLTNLGAADLVTITADGMDSTFLPLLFDPTRGEHGALLGHVARNNEQWKRPAIGDALVIAHGEQGYITPSYYASKAEHGRVVPTWNHLTVHVHGTFVVHDDPEWVGSLVRRLTEKYEAGRERPWAVSDAPEDFIAGQLRAIVGVEVLIKRIEAKAKYSQNRSAADVDGVVAGLSHDGFEEHANAVRAAQKNRESREG